MAAWLRVRLTAEMPSGALYSWDDDVGRQSRWLLFSSDEHTFQECDDAGKIVAGGMVFDLQAQTLANRVESEWRSFIQAAYGIWKAFQRDGQHPQSADRYFH